MAQCDDLITNEDLAAYKKDAEYLGLTVESPNHSELTPNGQLKRTISGINQDADNAISNAGGVPLGDGQYVLPDKTYTAFNQFLVQNGISYKPLTISHTTDIATYPNAADDPDLQPWQNLSELQTIARSINALDTQVIYSTDTTTLLDNVLYIYDATMQKTWATPILNGAGETIASVSGSSLITSGGSYILIPEVVGEGGFTTTRPDYNVPVGGASIGPIITLGDHEKTEYRNITAWANLGIAVAGKGGVVDGMKFTIADATHWPRNCVSVQEGAVAPLITGNYFDTCGYQIIQATGHKTEGVRVIGNTSIDTVNDFILQNNDSQNGVAHSWIVMGNYANHTNSDRPYGTTESRAISFTSIYGGINVGNASVGIKGDSATHLENVQETVHGFNYYRDCRYDILFSGEPDRYSIQLATIAGGDSIAVGDTLNGVTSGATGFILFWYEESRIAQVTNIVGNFLHTENYTITAKDTNGSIAYSDPVQVHANSIGNIFHKTGTQSLISTQLGLNNYILRNHFLCNTYNAQAARDVSTTIAVNAAFAYEHTHSHSTYRGWGTAFECGTTNDIKVSNNYFWNNTKNVNGSVLSKSDFDCNDFIDGDFIVGNLQATKIRNNKFKAGVIDISSSTNDNEWIDNEVSGDVVLTSLDVADFSRWKSTPYTKNGNVNEINTSATISGLLDDKQLIATISPLSSSTTATIEWNTTSRATGRKYAEMGRALITWNSSSTPEIFTDPSNFVHGNPTIGIDLTINGNDLEVSYILMNAGSGRLASTSIKILTEGTYVVPVEYLDIVN